MPQFTGHQVIDEANAIKSELRKLRATQRRCIAGCSKALSEIEQQIEQLHGRLDGLHLIMTSWPRE